MNTTKALQSLGRLARAAALAAAPLLAAVPAPAQAHFSRAELEQMLAPIALYPDSVLSHVLIAATRPEEVEEAARWSRRHPGLTGEAAVEAVEDRPWDPSVKALVAFPEILARMDEDPDWTDHLGEAFRYQEGEVMDGVQTLRDRADDAGHLGSLEHVRVIREREYIYIEPALRHVVYVPYYDPWYVYGRWWWPSHPPYCWRRWGGYAVAHYGGGFHWGVGFRVTPRFYFTTLHWPARHAVVVRRHAGAPPLYSGRDAVRHDGVRHWREARHDRSRSAPAWRRDDARVERRSGSRPARPESRPETREDRPEAQRWRTRPEAPRSREAAPAESRREHVRETREPPRGEWAARQRQPVPAWRHEAGAGRDPEHRGRAAPERRESTGRERREESRGRGDRGQAQGRGRSSRER